MNDEQKTKHNKRKVKQEEVEKEVQETEDVNEVPEEEKQELDDKQLEIDNLKNQLARALADYQNQNKRFQEERAQIFQYASQNVLENLIPVLDILEKAQEHLQDQGLGMAIGQFKKVLSDEGLEEIKPEVHNPFDPSSMEVVELVKSKVEDPERPEEVEGEEKETVAETLTSGWKFKDGKVVRYAKVKVFSGKAES